MNKEMKTEPVISSRGSSRYTKKSENSWKKVENSIKIDMTNTGLIISSRLEIEYGFISTRND